MKNENEVDVDPFGLTSAKARDLSLNQRFRWQLLSLHILSINPQSHHLPLWCCYCTPRSSYLLSARLAVQNEAAQHHLSKSCDVWHNQPASCPTTIAFVHVLLKRMPWIARSVECPRHLRGTTKASCLVGVIHQSIWYNCVSLARPELNFLIISSMAQCGSSYKFLYPARQCRTGLSQDRNRSMLRPDSYIITDSKPFRSTAFAVNAVRGRYRSCCRVSVSRPGQITYTRSHSHDQSMLQQILSRLIYSGRKQFSQVTSQCCRLPEMQMEIRQSCARSQQLCVCLSIQPRNAYDLAGLIGRTILRSWRQVKSSMQTQFDPFAPQIAIHLTTVSARPV